MMPLACIRITTQALACCFAAWVAAGCGASQSEIRTAQTSGYDTDFAIVYSQTLQAVRELYPHLTEDANAGIIKTAWHPLKLSEGQGRARSTQQADQTMGQNPFSGTTVVRKRFYIRFSVYVVGGHPWRVRVDGQASEWETGEIPVELKGADVPHWLKGRTEALQVAIYRRLKRYAVKLESTATLQKPAHEAEPTVDQKTQASLDRLPAGAAQAVAGVLKAAVARDYQALRAHMHPAFTWNLGAPADADQAVAIWQADSTILPQLAETIKAGCRADAAGARVTCPPDYVEGAAYQGYRAGFARGSGDQWKMIFFVSGD